MKEQIVRRLLEQPKLLKISKLSDELKVPVSLMVNAIWELHNDYPGMMVVSPAPHTTEKLAVWLERHGEEIAKACLRNLNKEKPIA